MMCAKMTFSHSLTLQPTATPCAATLGSSNRKVRKSFNMGSCSEHSRSLAVIICLVFLGG
jgi:hypothetical protein